MSRDVSVMTRSVMLKMANSAGHLFGGNFRPRGGKGNIGAADEAVSDEYDFHLVFSFWTVSSL